MVWWAFLYGLQVSVLNLIIDVNFCYGKKGSYNKYKYFSNIVPKMIGNKTQVGTYYKRRSSLKKSFKTRDIIKIPL